MELTMYGKLARALQEYFSAGDDTAILIVGFIVALGLLIIILQSALSSRETETVASDKDLDFFEVVIQQKGLENFDRDLLLELAEVGNIHPIYRILIEVQAYERALRKMEKEIHARLRNADEIPIRLDYLRRLKKRLFQ
ncbi:MAG TPA: hypothetical protein PKO06_08865 [Candidatus Ozemobacteraceae bacterium]|nr:hypothetical protein [Candidatus Ozemobacteraceae bacterium]